MLQFSGDLYKMLRCIKEGEFSVYLYQSIVVSNVYQDHTIAGQEGSMYCRADESAVPVTVMGGSDEAYPCL